MAIATARLRTSPGHGTLLLSLFIYICVFEYSLHRLNQAHQSQSPCNRIHEVVNVKPFLIEAPPTPVEYEALREEDQSTEKGKIENRRIIPVEWRRFSDEALTVPYPIFVTSLPKSGTSSIWKFFLCGKQKASHNWIRWSDKNGGALAGKCIKSNIISNRPPFSNCGSYDVYSDTGYLEYDHDHGEDCYIPSIDGLDAIYQHYPNATFVNVVRNSSEWYRSVRNYAHASLFLRMRLCNATNSPNGQSQPQDFIQFYEWQNDMIRKFVKARISLTYVEVMLESEDTGVILESRTGISSSCWKHCRPEVGCNVSMG